MPSHRSAAAIADLRNFATGFFYKLPGAMNPTSELGSPARKSSSAEIPMSSLIEQLSSDPASVLENESAVRAISIASGALLMVPILKKRSALSFTAAAAGGAMIYYGATMGGTLAGLAGSRTADATQTIRQSITIGKSATELFALWLNHDVVSKVMYPFGHMESLGSDHVKSIIELPVGRVELEALLVEVRPNELVHWRTVSDSVLQVDERMHFSPAPQGLGTVATLNYEVDFSRLPAGEMLRSVSSFFERAPRSMLRKVLENFKSIAETGEIPTLERNPSARANHNGKGDLV
jgi:uncharacterized membrane protein